MKLIKTRLQTVLLKAGSLRIAIESLDQLDEIEVILDIWNRKPRRMYIGTQLIIGAITLACAVICVKVHVTLCYT